MTTLAQEGMTDAQEADAHAILGLLTVCYPGHPWSVRVGGGVVFIRHLEFGSQWGMNLRVTEVDHDAAVLKRKVIMLAGEWLERAGLKRGRYDDEPIEHVEGVPEKWQPPEYRETKQVPNIVITTGNFTPLRVESRPQVLDELEKDGN